MKSGIDRIHDHLVDNIQFDLYNYLSVAFSTLETPTTTNRGRLCGSIHNAFTNIIDGLSALFEAVDGLGGPSASGN